jgi:hypothetical protein
MQTTDIRVTRPNRWRLKLAVKRFSIGQVGDHLNQALFNVDLLRPSSVPIVISGVLPLILLVQQVAHSSANNGGI